jgi:hypothetical protein
MRSRRRLFRGLLPVLLTSVLAGEGILATAEFDTDSYLFLGTNNASAPHLTVNPHSDTHGHFNFAVIRFPVGGLSLEGRKLLSVDLPFFVEGSINTGFNPADSGEAVVHVVALGASYAQYLLPSVAKRAWYDLNLHGRPIIGTYEFRSVDGDGLGRYTLDVTGVVNGWIEAPETNFGFGLWAERGSVDLSSADGPAESAPRLVAPAGVSYAEWVGRHFDADEAMRPALVDWRADPDGDGLPNGLEYRLGTDPRGGRATPFWHRDVGGRKWWRELDPTAHEGTLRLEGLDPDGQWRELGAASGTVGPDRVEIAWNLDGAHRLVRLVALAP